MPQYDVDQRQVPVTLIAGSEGCPVRDFMSVRFKPVNVQVPDRGLLFRSLETADLEALGAFYEGLSQKLESSGTARPTLALWQRNTATPSIGSTSFASWPLTA